MGLGFFVSIWLTLARAQDDGGSEGATSPPTDGGPADGGAPAAEEPEAVEAPEEVEGPPPTDRERLELAVAAYQSGRRDIAQGDLTGIIADEAVTSELRQEARIYLGEVLYVDGDTEGARRVFEQVLTADPDFQIDPFRHPPEILTQFEIARSSVVPFRQPTPVVPELSPLPAVGYMGFGLYQLREGRGAMGTTLLFTQGALGALSAVTFLTLLGDHGWQDGDESEHEALLRQRNLQWGATAGFWTCHLVGLIDAQRHWRKRGALEAAGEASSPTPQGSVPVHVSVTVPF